MEKFIILCGWISTIAGTGTTIYNLYIKYKKPVKDLEDRMSNLEEEVKDIKRKLDNDYSSIRSNREDMNLLMRSLFCLIENKLTGNNVEGLKKTRDALINALTDKQVM